MDELSMYDIFISETECDILKLRIGRLDVENQFSEEGVTQAIQDNGLNVLRIKIENPSREIYSRLEALPYPYLLLNISHAFESRPGREHISEDFTDITFIDYTEEHTQTMKTIVRESFSTHDGSYFYNPHIRGYYTPSDELRSMAEYISQNYHNGANRWSKLVLYKNKPVGFVSYILRGDTAYGDMFGVMPEYQSFGIGRKIGIYVLNHFTDKTVKNTIQIQNFKSLGLHYSLKMKPVGTVLNFHIMNNL